jgi:hypothetical protein
MLFGADRTALPWLDLAEGRLRLDRLGRNGGGETLLPCGAAHSSRGKKLSIAGPVRCYRALPIVHFLQRPAHERRLVAF